MITQGAVSTGIKQNELCSIREVLISIYECMSAKRNWTHQTTHKERDDTAVIVSILHQCRVCYDDQEQDDSVKQFVLQRSNKRT